MNWKILHLCVYEFGVDCVLSVNHSRKDFILLKTGALRPKTHNLPRTTLSTDSCQSRSQCPVLNRIQLVWAPDSRAFPPPATDATDSIFKRRVQRLLLFSVLKHSLEESGQPGKRASQVTHHHPLLSNGLRAQSLTLTHTLAWYNWAWVSGWVRYETLGWIQETKGLGEKNRFPLPGITPLTQEEEKIAYL